MGSNSSVRLLRREHSTPIPDDGSSPTTTDLHDFRFTVHYPSRLRPNRVDSVTVTLEPVRPLDRVLDIKRKKTENALPLRLLVPGAIVTPAEHAVEPSAFDSVEAVFQVAALADGDLSGSRLEILRQGQLDIIPLPLKCESSVPVRWLLALAVLLPALMNLPSCWPELAANQAIENAVREWLPNIPGLSGTIAQIAQGGYEFLAGSGKDVKVSFFAFLGLMVAAAVWAFVCRPQQSTATGPVFSHTMKPRSGDIPPLLTPASVDDVKAIHGKG